MISIIVSKETDNMKKYLVGLAVGGLMEQPEITYHDKQVIKAVSSEEAVKIYNRKNKCDFYYGHCLGEIEGDTVKVKLSDLMQIG